MKPFSKSLKALVSIHAKCSIIVHYALSLVAVKGARVLLYMVWKKLIRKECRNIAAVKTPPVSAAYSPNKSTTRNALEVETDLDGSLFMG